MTNFTGNMWLGGKPICEVKKFDKLIMPLHQRRFQEWQMSYRFAQTSWVTMYSGLSSVHWHRWVWLNGRGYRTLELRCYHTEPPCSILIMSSIIACLWYSDITFHVDFILFALVLSNILLHLWFLFWRIFQSPNCNVSYQFLYGYCIAFLFTFRMILSFDIGWWCM